MGFLDKAKDLLSKNADKVDTVIDKAGDLVDKKTQGKYASTVDKVQEAARKAVNDQTGQPGQPGQTGQTGQPGQTGTPAKPPVPPQQEPPTAPPVS
ncbi:MAG: antitoxin [Mycobacterium kyogaense]|uniref:antitoxin n=1 Tax=Mycobacterium kyogaense TaxID=2212479 RepID=UPI002FFA2F59